jgi:hypothetical protein
MLIYSLGTTAHHDSQPMTQHNTYDSQPLTSASNTMIHIHLLSITHHVIYSLGTTVCYAQRVVVYHGVLH